MTWWGERWCEVGVSHKIYGLSVGCAWPCIGHLELEFHSGFTAPVYNNFKTCKLYHVNTTWVVNWIHVRTYVPVWCSHQFGLVATSSKLQDWKLQYHYVSLCLKEQIFTYINMAIISHTYVKVNSPHSPTLSHVQLCGSMNKLADEKRPTWCNETLSSLRIRLG